MYESISARDELCYQRTNLHRIFTTLPVVWGGSFSYYESSRMAATYAESWEGTSSLILGYCQDPGSSWYLIVNFC